jgi:hypothetical protein
LLVKCCTKREGYLTLFLSHLVLRGLRQRWVTFVAINVRDEPLMIDLLSLLVWVLLQLSRQSLPIVCSDHGFLFFVIEDLLIILLIQDLSLLRLSVHGESLILELLNKSLQVVILNRLQCQTVICVEHTCRLVHLIFLHGLRVQNLFSVLFEPVLNILRIYRWDSVDWWSQVCILLCCLKYIQVSLGQTFSLIRQRGVQHVASLW